jgi:Mg-chelatase subunit ChlD
MKRLLFLLFSLIAHSTATAQSTPDFDALPVIRGSQSLDFPADTSTLIWLEPSQAGVFRISVEKPGLIQLYSFATEDGRFDGQSQPVLHKRAASMFRPVSMGPLLLGSEFPYILLVTSKVDNTVIVEQTLSRTPQPLGESPSLPGEQGVLFPISEHVPLAMSERAGQTLQVEALTEPRASRNIYIGRGNAGRQWVTEASLLPRVIAENDVLHVESSADTGPAPLVWIRTTNSGDGLDEREPNYNREGGEPQRLDSQGPFRAVATADGDVDTFFFEPPQAFAGQLTLAPVQAFLEYELKIWQHNEGQQQRMLLERRQLQGEQTFDPLHLPAGRLFVQVVRTDKEMTNVDYTLSLTPADAAPGRLEREPNDSIPAATALPQSGAIRGALSGNNDRDFIAFDVPVEGHHWRLTAIRGVERLILHAPPTGTVIDTSVDGNRLTADALALNQGRYVAELRGEGEYAFKVMDLGPKPDDYEQEPNNGGAQAQRLYLGDKVTGLFHDGNDIDLYSFEVLQDTPMEIALDAPQDGDIQVYLTPLDGGDFGVAAIGAEQSPYRYRAVLPMGRYHLRLRPLTRSMRGTYTLALSPLAALADNEPDHLPTRVTAMPLDGRWASDVGGLDQADFLHLPLPAGEGNMVLGCYHPDNLRWDLNTYGDNQRLLRGHRSPQVLAYTPELGGGARLFIDGGQTPSDYHCLGFLPPPASPDLSDQTLQDVLANGASPGHRWTIPLADSPPESLPLNMAAGDFAAVRCRQTGLSETTTWREVRVDGANFAEQRLDDWAVFFATERPSMHFSHRRLDAANGDLQCELLGPEQFKTLADAQPLAVFDAITRRAPEDQAEQSRMGHYAPVLLQAQRPDWLNTSQTSNDLPVALSVGEMPALAAYSKRGQRLEVPVKLRNDSGEALSVALSAQALADGWRVSPESAEQALPPGGEAQLTLNLIVPPMASPATRPALALTARAGDRTSHHVSEIPLDVAAAEQAPFTYWDAPEPLRGGLNVLRYQMGSTLIQMGNKAPDDGDRGRIAALHDGLAPHIGLRPLYTEQGLTFALAEATPVVGAMFHLRSTRARDEWPSGYRLELANGDTAGWQVVAEGPLTGSNRPQYVVFDALTTADRVRLQFTGCRGNPDCSRVYAQEAQLIAQPGWRPSDAINIAAPEHGGHIVHANRPFAGNWHFEWLEPDNRFNPFREINPRWGEQVKAVLGFHQNRAAAIKRVEWLNKPEELPRFPEALVEYSLAGPGGPWRELGTLSSPPEGETLAALELDAPVWARYLRFTLQRDPEQRLYGPQQLRVFEDRDTLSLLGLWEVDSPRAAYEYLEGTTDPAAPEPKGGPSAEQARALPMERRVNSSVLLERNEDWWAVKVDGEQPSQFNLTFYGHGRQEFLWTLEDSAGERIAMRESTEETELGERRFEAVLPPGDYRLRLYEPPRSIIISWDTSGSVGAYIPRTLAAVRTWATSLAPGREALQLLPFGFESPYLPDWAESPQEVLPFLRYLPTPGSSSAEDAMLVASEALIDRDGARGIVIITDAETPYNYEMWGPALEAEPRVISLSIDSDGRHNAAIMMDWANINRGHFHRVVGQMGLADGLDMAAALFRTPKAYALEASLSEIQEVQGEATLTINASDEADNTAGAVQLILDASGSMLQPLPDGQRRITVARQALMELARERLPEGANFAFRAFGWEANACRTELVVPLAPLDREAAATAMRRVPAVNLSKTPIADSLLAAREDLAEAGEPRVIVLVTDGEETCGGDVDAALAALREAQFNVRVNVVGFAVDDPQLIALFESWAENGGGAYFDASQGDALASAIDRAMQPGFAVIREYRDGREERVATLGLGESMSVPAGQLRIEPLAGAVGEAVRINLRDQQNVSLRYRGNQGLASPQP